METHQERHARQLEEWQLKRQELAHALVTTPVTSADEAESLLVGGTWLHAGPYRPVVSQDTVTHWVSDYGDVIVARLVDVERVTTSDAWRAYVAHLRAKPAPVCSGSGELVRSAAAPAVMEETSDGRYYCGDCEEPVPLVEDSGDMHIAAHDTDGEPLAD